ncbi:hypothetical protein TNCT_715501 [Trichonephila clavata]|uniref:Uncharacterized protein n=1 Tax=Trichonephila clavata TaxID=2740835 RepID=A0A8X6GBS1_TRICU|nr:hypothetical protein TNCT_715501 [Trichonephila clavata]
MSQVYHNSPSSLVEMKDAIRHEFSCIQPKILHAEMDGVITRLQTVICVGTSNIERETSPKRSEESDDTSNSDGEERNEEDLDLLASLLSDSESSLPGSDESESGMSPVEDEMEQFIDEIKESEMKKNKPDSEKVEPAQKDANVNEDNLQKNEGNCKKRKREPSDDEARTIENCSTE